jgi:hypothetical protein
MIIFLGGFISIWGALAVKVILIVSSNTSIDRTHQAASNDIEIIIGTHSQANRRRKEKLFQLYNNSIIRVS